MFLTLTEKDRRKETKGEEIAAKKSCPRTRKISAAKSLLAPPALLSTAEIIWVQAHGIARPVLRLKWFEKQKRDKVHDQTVISAYDSLNKAIQREVQAGRGSTRCSAVAALRNLVLIIRAGRGGLIEAARNRHGKNRLTPGEKNPDQKVKFALYVDEYARPPSTEHITETRQLAKMDVELTDEQEVETGKRRRRGKGKGSIGTLLLPKYVDRGEVADP